MPSNCLTPGCLRYLLKKIDGSGEQGGLDYLERDDLGRDRRVHVGSENHPDRVLKRRDTRGDESDHEYRGDLERPDTRGYESADKCGAEAVCGRFCQQILSAPVRHDFERLGHLVHPLPEQRQTTHQIGHYHAEIDRAVHDRSPRFSIAAEGGGR